jgi:TfoX/Sxy family transcriptional regulator of competence genes
MRPRADSSAGPISSADVNSGLIEVSPSVLMLATPVKPPIGEEAPILEARMAYDKELAGRIRSLIGDEPGLTEQKMFGGLAFLIGGNMAIGASGQGGILVRVDPEESQRLVATTSASPMEMRGREMRGWLRVDADDVRTPADLAKWVDLGTAFARSLPTK